MVKIKQDNEACIGCGACVSVCPENWKFVGAKPKPIKTEVKEVGCNRQAADVCPVACITIEE
ncbi:MAG: ferredoxin [archaeon]|jgi:ferredoxin|nr:ferredoxin [archaeon]MDD2477383.1 ferredoxin [Candidatus ainarchaeum sp.]MDD3084504.1 ferredoxin [Candidatus ainarchaeum sp.]MDD4220785.1 ferredoxin [Candidatus ainarchaeum sp.]MDD4662284.1 ferredoxin [Candidatus ainarchaeum sp.]